MARPNNHQGDWQTLECALILNQPPRKEETANTTEFCSFCTLIDHLFPFSQIYHKGNKHPSIKKEITIFHQIKNNFLNDDNL